jgi:hypothetical protein
MLKAAPFRVSILVRCVTAVAVLAATASVAHPRESPVPVRTFARTILCPDVTPMLRWPKFIGCEPASRRDWDWFLRSMPGHPMSLGCERSDIYLDLISVGLPATDLEPWETRRIRLTRGGRPRTDIRRNPGSRLFAGGHSVLLTDLKQLQGLVRISDEQVALRLVRLRTSPFTWYAWGDQRFEVEIVSETQALSLPDFGVRRWRESLSPVWSGRLGILFDQDYLTRRFEPARVERVHGGFEVARWIFWTSGHEEDATVTPRRGIQLIREFVGEDGEYKRSTVADVSVERAPGLEIPLSRREGWKEMLRF